MCNFPLDPTLSRAILQAHEEKCLKEVRACVGRPVRLCVVPGEPIQPRGT